MSDADDQMGGTGGEYGRPPQQTVPGQNNAAPAGSPSDPHDDEPADDGGTDPASDDQESADQDSNSTEESFPASDPPSNY